jgi:hypothetical protein
VEGLDARIKGLAPSIQAGTGISVTAEELSGEAKRVHIGLKADPSLGAGAQILTYDGGSWNGQLLSTSIRAELSNEIAKLTEIDNRVVAPSWDDLTKVLPAGLSDGEDNMRTDDQIRSLLYKEGYITSRDIRGEYIADNTIEMRHIKGQVPLSKIGFSPGEKIGFQYLDINTTNIQAMLTTIATDDGPVSFVLYVLTSAFAI